MIPDPLHPSIVHFPIVLMFLVPLAGLIALWAIRQGARVSRAWLVPAAFAAALSLSAWVALETGEDQSERVEQVVPEAVLEGHEDGAKAFLALTTVLLVVTAAGFLEGTVGRAARWTATVGAVAVMGFGVSVGHSGGQLVYRHGAASAYATPSAIPAPGTPRERGEREGP